jgi:hypothetical protein
VASHHQQIAWWKESYVHGVSGKNEADELSRKEITESGSPDPYPEAPPVQRSCRPRDQAEESQRLASILYQ